MEKSIYFYIWFFVCRHKYRKSISSLFVTGEVLPKGEITNLKFKNKIILPNFS